MAETVEPEPAVAVDPLEDLKARYEAAVGRLRPFLAVSRRVVAAGHGAALTDAVRQQRAARPVLAANPGDDPAPLLSEVEALETRVAAFETAAKDVVSGDRASPTDRLGRFFAWFEGDTDRATPPPRPKPKPKPKAKPTPPAEVPAPAESNPPLESPAAAAPEEKSRRSAWGWISRIAALALLVLSFSALTDGTRRAELAVTLQTDRLSEVRSFADAADWAGSVNWAGAGSDLSRYVFEDVGWAAVSIATLSGAVVEMVSRETPPEPAPSLVEPPATVADHAPDSVAEAVEEASIATAPTEPRDPVEYVSPSGADRAQDLRDVEAPPVLNLEDRLSLNAAELAAKDMRLTDALARLVESERYVDILAAQNAELRSRIADLQAIIDDAVMRDAASQVQLQSLGTQLNTALARVAAEERRRRELEEAERARLEAIAVVEQSTSEPQASTDEKIPKEPTNETEVAVTHRVSASLVNARSGPSTNFDIITTLNEGTSLSRIDESSGWLLVRVLEGPDTGVEVWIAGRLLRKAVDPGRTVEAVNPTQSQTTTERSVIDRILLKVQLSQTDRQLIEGMLENERSYLAWDLDRYATVEQLDISFCYGDWGLSFDRPFESALQDFVNHYRFYEATFMSLDIPPEVWREPLETVLVEAVAAAHPRIHQFSAGELEERQSYEIENEVGDNFWPYVNELALAIAKHHAQTNGSTLEITAVVRCV